ncbi:MAG: SRPBCC family protein [Microthrixaceae bacterium]
MSTVHEHIDIDASPAAVWEVLADVSRLPELSGSTTRVRVDGMLHTRGQTFEQTVRLAGRSWTSTWQVEEIDPGRLLRISGSLPGGTPSRMVERLEPRGDSGCRLSIDAVYELPMGALGRLAGRLGVERRARDELREVLEGVARLSRGPARSGVPRGR